MMTDDELSYFEVATLFKIVMFCVRDPQQSQPQQRQINTIIPQQIKIGRIANKMNPPAAAPMSSSGEHSTANVKRRSNAATIELLSNEIILCEKISNKTWKIIE